MIKQCDIEGCGVRYQTIQLGELCPLHHTEQQYFDTLWDRSIESIGSAWVTSVHTNDIRLDSSGTYSHNDMGWRYEFNDEGGFSITKFNDLP